MADLLTGKVAVITGAASGMGRSAAEVFVANGARVVLADVQDGAGVALAERLGAAARFVHTDVTAEADLERAVGAAREQFGRLDVMFSNAGAAVDLAPVAELTAEGLDRTLRLNLHAHVTAHRLAAAAFREQRVPGSIISTASIAALQAGWNGAAYSMAKAAVLALVRQTALEAAGTGIRCNAILPGAVLTSIITNMFGIPAADEEQFLTGVGEAIADQTLIGRAGVAEDIANTALFLASDLSTWITGTSITVDGGATAYTKDATVAAITEIASAYH
ncbi:SDR family oxidoreductase [Tsukamurella sp. NPDC003166]|uniref:SDR family NAD(P)-dependent oxidoreductase n=1 Tax=Tsukamurella sp. NPDC003166 TaxID=3154444 RepID=UPI0033AFB8FD